MSDVVKKTVYDKLVAKVNKIDTRAFVSKTVFLKTISRRQKRIRKKIADVTGFGKESKLTELENKILNVSSLAKKTALTAVENKIPSISSLVKETIYDTKISELEKKISDHNHDKYVTTPEFNALAADVFNARLAQANLVTKTDFDVKLSSLNRNIISNKSKHLLVENELKELKNLIRYIYLEKFLLEKMVYKII